MKRLACLCLVGLSIASAASAAPLYRIMRLGFDDVEHTSAYGVKYSDAKQLNEAGLVIGSSERWNGGSTLLGQSAWVYDGTTTINIGFTGPEYTRSDGFKSSSASKLNDAGQVSGVSARYNGSTSFGSTAWLYDGATKIEIGLNGAEHTSNDGARISGVIDLNQPGQVRGYSYRYNGGSTDLGQSVWLYNGMTTVEIGLTGPEYTRSDGYQWSYSYPFLYHPTPSVWEYVIGYTKLNQAGQVVSFSNRYNGGSTILGKTAWLYDGATTIALGFAGPDGNLFSTATELNEAGQVSGSSSRSGGGGSSAWLYDGATTIDIGLTGSEHTRNDGYKSSGAGDLNEAGQVIGESMRFNGGSIAIGPERLALRRRDDDRHRFHRSRVHAQRRPQIQRRDQAERRWSGQRRFHALQRQHVIRLNSLAL